jgi:hypothetical protein
MVQHTDFDSNYSIRDKLLSAACARLSVAQTLAEIIEIVRSSARAACSADGATFVMRDGNQCHYVEEDAIAPLWKGRRYPMVHCISGWAMLNGKTAVIEDVFVDPRIPHDVYRPTFVKSLIMAPTCRAQAVAAIGLYWSIRRQFSDHDIRSAERLAAWVGSAINTVRAAPT